MSAFSTGIPGSRSLLYAERMARLCGVPFQSSPLGPEFVRGYAASVESNVCLTDAMSFSSESEALWLRDHVPPGVDVMVHGAFAELYKIAHMHRLPWDAHHRRGGRAGLEQEMRARAASRLARRSAALAPEVRRGLMETLEENMPSGLAPLPRSMSLAGLMQALYLEDFLGTVSVASGKLWNARVPTAFPFSYPPYVDLLLRVRAEDKADFRFPLQVLSRTNPALAAFPDSNTGARIGASARSARPSALAMLRAARLPSCTAVTTSSPPVACMITPQERNRRAL
jgi:hypothetical protein